MNSASIGAFAASASALFLSIPQASYAQQSEAPTKPRICVVTPAVQLGQGTNPSGDPAAPVMASLVAYLSGPAADVVALKSRVSVQVNAEAAQLGCSHIVDTTITQKKAGKGFKGLLAAVPALASAVPVMGGGGAGSYAAASVASAAASGMVAAQQQQTQEEIMAAMDGVAQSNIKKGDEITLKYDLTRVGAAAAITNGQLKAKAKDNGQDILSPLLEQTANEVLTAAMAPNS